MLKTKANCLYKCITILQLETRQFVWLMIKIFYEVLNFVYCQLTMGFVILNKKAIVLILLFMATEFEEKRDRIEEFC